MKTLEQMGADQSAKVTAGREEILYQAARGGGYRSNPGKDNRERYFTY